MDENEYLFAESAVEFVGPIEHHAVIVNGFRVPHITATPIPGGQVYLNLDNRYGIDVPVGQVDGIVEFIANCIAVAKGYTCHPQRGWEGPVPRHPFQQVTRLDLVSD
jgi:hypothetical protein